MSKHLHKLKDDSFRFLMRNRINNVLIISSTYDYFILEEDGRIDEQIFNEYIALGLNYPPQFFHVTNEKDAAEIIKNHSIDLIITMFSSGYVDTFDLADRLKNNYPELPVIVLTPFSREVSLRLHQKKVDMKQIDHVFCWLGHAEILLAIIKLIEDKMNVQDDIDEVGVQTIILVENSIRFYSSCLPHFYKIIFTQSKSFMTEGLNHHQQMLRMRGRPKILLATNFEEAIELYEKHKNHILGVISDVAYDVQGVRDKEAGIKLVDHIRQENPYLPILLQSTNVNYKTTADDHQVGFIHKYSKSWNTEVQDYIIQQFAFGDFVFRDPYSNLEIDRARDLQTFQQKILELPENSLRFHASNNHFSSWLKARALFKIAEQIAPIQIKDFETIEDMRKYIFNIIAQFRHAEAHGTIAEFNREHFDEYFLFSRIGNGSIGGKARGLAFMDSLIKRNNLQNKFLGITVSIPRTVVLTTEIFDEFMEFNKLNPTQLGNMSDEQIMDRFVNASLPHKTRFDLAAFISVVKKPIAVRSSSLLEDSYYQPFAGIYKTYMIPYLERNAGKTRELLETAIKLVYASVFYKSGRTYISATANVIDSEKMSILLQEVCGNKFNNRYYPHISGIAHSINFYPIAPEKASDGIVNLAFGLGKYAVDGGITLRFSPKHAKKILQLATPETALKETQKYFFALDLNPDHFSASVDESVNILKLPINDAEQDNTLSLVCSTYDLHNNTIYDGIVKEGKKVITFANILKHNTIPLPEIITALLEIAEQEINTPVEIEFALAIDPFNSEPVAFNLLQIRPIVESKEHIDINPLLIKKEECIVVAEKALGNCVVDNIHYILYVKPEVFDKSNNQEIANRISSLNDRLVAEGKNYILIGPGRWGSSDPWLGVPVKWQQVSGARAIVEASLKDYHIEPSQGTHFFLNLTSFGVGYFTVNPHLKDGYYDSDYLNAQPAEYEDEHIRLVRSEQSLLLKIDGKKGVGFIKKFV